jgi:hypothetical protein
MALVTWFIVEGRIDPFKTEELRGATFRNAEDSSETFNVSSLSHRNHFGVYVGQKTDVIVGAPGYTPGYKSQVVNTGTNQCGDNQVSFQCPHIRVTLDRV